MAGKETIIKDANTYKAYHEFLLFVKEKNDSNYSDDFSNPRTQRLYEFSKQIIALWAINNDCYLVEKNETVIPTIQQSPLPELPIIQQPPTKRWYTSIYEAITRNAKWVAVAVVTGIGALSWWKAKNWNVPAAYNNLFNAKITKQITPSKI